MKCRYKYCKHPGEEVSKDDAAKKGTQYFHKDCFKEREEKEKIVKLFLDKINPNTPVPQLRKTVNTIVNTKGIDSEFLLFGLKYYINNKMRLNYPAGLYYVIANKEMEAEYNKLKNAGKKMKFTIEEDTTPTFVYRPPKRKTIDNFMEG